MPFSEMIVQFPNSDEIKCGTCKYRDKGFYEIGEKKCYTGITKDTCDKYTGGPERIFKSNDILFYNTDCKYYEKE